MGSTEIQTPPKHGVIGGGGSLNHVQESSKSFGARAMILTALGTKDTH